MYGKNKHALGTFPTVVEAAVAVAKKHRSDTLYKGRGQIGRRRLRRRRRRSRRRRRRARRGSTVSPTLRGPGEFTYQALQKERQNNQGPSKLAVLALEAKWKAAEGGAVLKGGKAVLKDARSPTEGVMVIGEGEGPGNYQMLPPGSAGPPEADGSPNHLDKLGDSCTVKSRAHVGSMAALCATIMRHVNGNDEWRTATAEDDVWTLVNETIAKMGSRRRASSASCRRSLSAARSAASRSSSSTCVMTKRR